MLFTITCLTRRSDIIPADFWCSSLLYLANKKLVVSHPEWSGPVSELLMSAWEFYMGRYGDFQLDMLLATPSFFLSGGRTSIPTLQA